MNEYVDELREAGRGWAPYVAALHGGVEAQVLSILRDPGRATQDEVGSGFICVENNDCSAELQAVLLEEAGISPLELLRLASCKSKFARFVARRVLSIAKEWHFLF